ncbi:phosphatase PAP2 family protein [Porphyromonas sp.]|uniref:phosphatase PAP2 family protein n=1 Tax=Porphyromonas sp. TaxID=1924944 RepID=UPI0026DB0198|nr:phosphatase PAP2 family protein [Porphyromonas sp.]MDO4770417.1 phosphatase PAP2 family protein [Porphyromonas sp.]
MKRFLYLLVFVALFVVSGGNAQTSLSVSKLLPAEKRISPAKDRGSRYVPYVNTSAFSAIAIPLQISVGMGSVLWDEDQSLRSLRHHYISDFRTRVDDYTQLFPLALMWGMRIGGVGDTRSETVLESVVAQASSFALLSLFTLGGKYTIGRLRPDNSSRNFFPSGHTGTAFACAAILDAEYGHRYPWLAAAGYGVAALTGVSRVANNRHWGTDVLTGASVGPSSVYLGYMISDLVFGRKRPVESHPTVSGEASPYMLSLDNGRTGLFSQVGSFTPDRLTLSLGLSVRVPIYRRIGVVTEAKLIRAENREVQEHLNAGALLVGGSYMRPLLGDRVWWDAHALAGYLSSGRITRFKEEVKPVVSMDRHTSQSFMAKVGMGVTVVTHNTFAMRLSGAYLFAPDAVPYEGDAGKTNKGYEAVLSLSYLINP